MRTIALAGLVALTTALGGAVAAAGPVAAASAASAATPAAPATAHDLFGVSCVSAKNCIAVGLDIAAFSKGTGGVLAETWNGTAWKKIAVRLPAGATTAALGQVSCLSKTDCLAVGMAGKNPAALYPLADTWNGKTWTPVRLPGAAGPFTNFTALSCWSATHCMGAGSSTTTVKGTSTGRALAETWNGRQWRQTAPPPAPPGTLTSVIFGVSCVSATFCVADGQYATKTTSGGLIDEWNGRTWSRMQAVVPRGTANGFLTGLACVSAKNCFAVGFSANARGLVSVAEKWNGKSWALTPVPWPKGTTNPQLTGVSCLSASLCVAVAAINQNLMPNSNQGKAAAAVWNGKAWATSPTPTPAKGIASLFNGVTCMSASNCIAVGEIGPAGTTNGVGLSGFWNGKKWHLVTAK